MGHCGAIPLMTAWQSPTHSLPSPKSLRKTIGRVDDIAATCELVAQHGGEVLWDTQLGGESVFVRDPDGELEEGAMLIDSELLLPAQPDLGVGERTRRLTSSVSPNRSTTTREEVVSAPGSSATHLIFARVSYEDRAGRHTHEVVKDSITIGRGGIAYPVDIRVSSSEDVSREHARIRRDPQTGRFFLIDLSRLGTTLNGRHVPRGYEETDGARRENGAETPLPDRGRIGLADTLYLDFERIS